MWHAPCKVIVGIILITNLVTVHSWPLQDDNNIFSWLFKTDEDDEWLNISSNNLNVKSREIRNYMDQTIDPCEDFYEYACGNWGKYHIATANNQMTSQLDVLREEVDSRVNDLLMKYDRINDDVVDRKVKDFYASCINKDAIKKQGNEPLIKLIQDFGGMPALNTNWNHTTFDWLETIAKLRYKFGLEIIIGLDIVPDLQNNEINRIYVGEPTELPLVTKSMYLDEAAYGYREQYKISVGKTLGEILRLSKEIANQTAEEIMNFETKLAFGMYDHRLGIDFKRLFKERSVKDLSSAYPEIDIQKFLQISFGEEITSMVYEIGDHYLPQLVKIIKEEDKKVIANYIMWRTIDQFRFIDEIDPKKRRKLCAQKTTKFFSKVVGNMFYQKYSDADTDKDVNQIWLNLKESLKENFRSDNLKWISDETRQKALNKIDSIEMKILSYRTENFTKEFGDLQIRREHFLENIMNILELEHRKEIQRLHKKPEPLAVQDIEASSVNAGYITMENKIQIPLGILQPKFWDITYPNSLKYATIGFIVAHELIHGFDDLGRNFDDRGNMKSWWDDKSTKEFEKRTKCFNQQYNTYRFDTWQLPASEVQTENIADNAGIKVAFQAYMKWLQNTDDKHALRKETLPGFDFTNTQLFFLSYAQIWCTEVHSSAKLILVMTDDHVPGKFRVNVPLSNFKEFSREFNCLPGTGMNPANKCSLY